MNIIYTLMLARRWEATIGLLARRWESNLGSVVTAMKEAERRWDV